MKKIFIPIAALAITVISCKKEEAKTEATPEATKPETEVADAVTEIPDSTTITNAWTAYMTPSKAHEMLAKDTGKWTADMKFWNSYTPDAPAETMQSTAEYKMILDGRYQEGVYKGEMWGMPFEGRSTTAFDNASQQYISTWIDNMGTGLMVMRGTYDENSKAITLTGSMMDPVTKKEKNQKEVLTYIDENTQKMEMYDVNADGTEFKTMEIISKRVK
ncbi:DUF1579 domain-containing protein [Flavobacterium sp.]|uniref:DUF1579 domain-containing protein n=1 Tax=Flavobacterium sp. TaxID=239 RepID=UPI0035287FF1